MNSKERERERNQSEDHLYGLVVRIPGYISRGPGFDHPALPDFVRNSVSGTGSTQPREDN
jgi:hypothetical protein